ncbi:unnamed protein product, partial [Ectocarpus sp. 12 AP-2014]
MSSTIRPLLQETHPSTTCAARQQPTRTRLSLARCSYNCICGGNSGALGAEGGLATRPCGGFGYQSQQWWRGRPLCDDHKPGIVQQARNRRRRAAGLYEEAAVRESFLSWRLLHNSAWQSM